jgi:nitrite reductase (NO-forming)
MASKQALRKEVPRRSFLERLLIATGVVSSGAIAGSAYMAMSGDRPGGGAALAAEEWDRLAAQATFKPARAVTTAEVSRHPAVLPPNPDYTLYEEGRYQNTAARSGSIVQEVHFHIAETTAEVVSGATMAYWTFDGTVPGPMIRARVGDTIDFFLHNPQSSSLPHNVDFHAVNGPGGGAARLATAPGEVSELRAKLLNPGIFVYHCAFPDIPMHISHGMYGLIVVEPEGGLPRVDHEFYLMQSEFYTDKGSRQQYVQLKDGGHLEFSADFGRLEQPTFVVFNGRPEAIGGERSLGMFQGNKINVGETVRLFVGNIGPNLASSFHVIGEIFDRVYVEGSFDLVNRNVQSTLIPAGGAAGVEFKVDYPGDYTIVDHSIFRVHKGAAGNLHVEGEADPAVFQPIKYNTQLTGGH